MKGLETYEDKQDQQLDRDLFINSGNQKALEILKRHQIKISDFVDLYGQPQVEQDSQRVEELLEKFDLEDEGYKYSNIFEAFMVEDAELCEWFGENSHIIPTSPFDDFTNGVDNIIEYNEDPATSSHLALAIDVTFRNDLGEKFDRIRREIETGKLAHIKYFKSQHAGFRGELFDIPRFVVATSVETIRDISENFAKGKHNEFVKHPLRLQIIESLILQCQGFKNFALQANQKGIAAKYEHIEELLRKILEEKPVENPDAVRQQFDEGYFQILQGLETLSRTAPAPKRHRDHNQRAGA